ncbi:unnamed protein product [Calicophoron daubneyi]|uniref:Uncharacterized protein n=1 Tax=Calicophoron daubneyi TaxID=300641 RepID=A0AAV2TTK9_CALDB
MMTAFRLYAWLVLAVLLNLELSLADKHRISPLSSGKRRYPSNKYGYPSYSRGHSLSKSKLKYLFPTVGALGGIYIASRMRSHVRLHSYHDLDRFTVCEGKRTEVLNGSGFSRTYSYFLCPDDPNQPFERHCCRDPETYLGFCCSASEKSAMIHSNGPFSFGIVVALLVVLCFIGVFIYCCYRFRRNRRQYMAQPRMVCTSTPGAFSSGPKPGVSPQPQQPSVPPPSYPYGPTPYPSYPVPPYGTQFSNSVPPQPGSAWGGVPPPAISTVGGAPGSQWTSPNDGAPPPPYPGHEAAPPYPTAPPSS